MRRTNLSHRERLERCLSDSDLDRVPVALWRHFPVDDQSPENLADATINFQQAYDFDLVKVTPASSFCVKDWGVQDEWRGATEGTRDYTHHVVSQPEDWVALTALNPKAGYLGSQLRCIEIIVNQIGKEVPVIQTIFNPLSQAKNLVGKERLLAHIRQYPAEVHSALKTITETTIRFIEAVKKAGITGIFFAVQHAQFGLLSAQEYADFGRKYDIPILQSAGELWLNMLHLHGEEVMYKELADYPVAVINWHDRDTKPSLAEGQKYFSGAVCGGLQREKTMVLGSPDQVQAEAQAAMEATAGRRFILGTGCVVPITAPRANLLAARQSVDR